MTRAWESCLYEGTVVHDRRTAPSHRLSVDLQLLYLDLEELPEVLDRGRMVSAHRAAVVRFRRGDHLGPERLPLAECVRALVRERLGLDGVARVTLLTHPRLFGLGFNPVSFYYCWSHEGALVAVLAEVSNTPWGERHVYLLDARGHRGAAPFRARFAKAFHVSPFLGDRMTYEWAFTVPGERLSVTMRNLEDGGSVFSAALHLRRRPLATRALVLGRLAFPPMTIRVLGSIYAHAAWLWLRRAPFHPHPQVRFGNAAAPTVTVVNTA